MDVSVEEQEAYAQLRVDNIRERDEYAELYKTGGGTFKRRLDEDGERLNSRLKSHFGPLSNPSDSDGHYLMFEGGSEDTSSHLEYFQVFGKPMPIAAVLNDVSGIDDEQPSTSQPQPVRRRRRSSTPRVTRKPVRRSTRTCRSLYASNRRERGFMGFPFSVFLRWTKYRGRPLTVDRVDDDVSQVPEATADLEYTVCMAVEVPLDLIPAQWLTPEMSGNGWKDGVELDSDDEVEINLEEDVTDINSEEDVTYTASNQGGSDEAGPSCSRPRRPSNRATPSPFLRVEDVTPDLLNRICYTSRKSRVGNCSTCHQCRSGSCRGLRGMFCGNCLQHRYGEDVAVVLMDPNWKCPPCRKLCNCSICRSRARKAPTGPLFPKVAEKGYRCVSDYLKDVEGN